MENEKFKIQDMTRAFYQLLTGVLVMLPFFLHTRPEITATNGL
jgi:hypothetical protein